MKTISIVIALCVIGCNSRHVAVSTPKAPKLSRTQKAYAEGYAAAERSFADMLTEDHKARGFTDAQDAYKHCIDTIVRVGRTNTDYRIQLEGLKTK